MAPRSDLSPTSPLARRAEPSAPAANPGALPPRGAGRRAPARVEQRVFWMSWTSYFSYYFTRQQLSVAKTPLQQELHLTNQQLSWIDLAYLSSYCVGQFVHGAIGDVIGPRRLVALGMLASAAISLGFGLSSALAVFVLLWGLNGFVQASGWPGNGKLMASWFSTRERGKTMGLWSTCYQAGGVAAKLVATTLLAWGWRAAFLGPALWVVVVAGGFWLLVRDRPSDYGYSDPEISEGISREELRRLRRAAWPQVLRNLRTWCLGANYFFLKLMRYAFLFWLPKFLHDAYGYSKVESGLISMAFDAGGIPFVILVGYLADRFFGGRRIAVAIGCCALLVGALALYREISAAGPLWQLVGLMLVGGTLFGADSLVSGSAAQDVGGPHAAALACGVVNGLGSLGGIVQVFATVMIADVYGWQAMFAVFTVLAAVSVLPLLPYWRVGPPVAAR